MESALEAGWRKAGSPTTSLGGSSGIVTTAHPLLNEIRRAREQAQALAQALGLDPAARRSLSRNAAGRPQGAASAADRVAPARRKLKAA
jgi:phage terminase small subunit